MRAVISVCVIALAFAFAVPAASASPDTPAYVTAALNDPARKDDTVDDARRQAAAVVTFSGVKPGDKVLELVPGRGYWTRIFSNIAGERGHVYTVWPNEEQAIYAKGFAEWQQLVKAAPYTNVSLLQQPAATLSSPEPVDLVFICQNYHDYHAHISKAEMAELDRQVFAALKPGGLLLVIDHSAPAGSGDSESLMLERIDPGLVRKELEATGFVFDGASDALRNPKDPLNVATRDPSVFGHTDQFIFRFRKPASP